jgi:hypothetical protein
MASTVSLDPEYVYVGIRIKIVVDYNQIIPDVVVCHYGETYDVFLIGGLVLPNETWVVCALRHRSHLVWFHFPEHQRLYLYHVFDGTINQESAKIFMFVMDVTMSETLGHLQRR